MNKEEILNKYKEYSIFPGQIKINNCTYFGLDYELTDFVNHLAEQNKKYKEVIDKIQKHCEIEINASNHYLENHSSQKELCHKVAHQRILDILKEV